MIQAVTFLSLNIGGYQQPLKGLSSRIARILFLSEHSPIFFFTRKHQVTPPLACKKVWYLPPMPNGTGWVALDIMTWPCNVLKWRTMWGGFCGGSLLNGTHGTKVKLDAKMLLVICEGFPLVLVHCLGSCPTMTPCFWGGKIGDLVVSNDLPGGFHCSKFKMTGFSLSLFR